VHITKNKIFGIGLNKTGTTTLGKCFKILGFTHIGCEPDNFKSYKNGNFGALFEVIQKYESFEDWPWPMIYKEADEAFPGNKFILTIRKNPDVWYDSLCKYAERSGPTEYRRVIYGYDMPHGHRNHHIDFYNTHNKNVKEYFKDKHDKLLEICWESGHGWKELCEFIGRGIPESEFPHENKYSLIKGKLKYNHLKIKGYFHS